MCQDSDFFLLPSDVSPHVYSTSCVAVHPRWARGSICLLAIVTDAAVSILYRGLRAHVFLFLLGMARWLLKVKVLQVYNQNLRPEVVGLRKVMSPLCASTSSRAKLDTDTVPRHPKGLLWDGITDVKVFWKF